MAVAKRVLSVSYDRDRLDTRNEILRREGYNVLSTRDVRHAIELSQEADAVIVGDSIPDVEKKALLTEIRRLKSIPVVILHNTFVPTVPADANVHILDGPARLLDELRKVLT